MKKLLGIVAAIVAVLAMTVPAAAQTSVTTSAVVGGGGVGAPRMVALFLTPDEVDAAGDGTNVLPEPAIPNAPAPLFPSPNANEDGWKRVNIYVAVADDAVPFKSSINGVDVTVNYPAATPYSGQQKFNITATKGEQGQWTANDNYLVEQRYPVVPSEGPLGVLAVEPSWTVRELTPATPGTTDLVDRNADGIVGNDLDERFATFLGTWGSRVHYGTGYDATIAGADFNANKILVLELVGWIWYHQDPVWYTYTAVGYGTGGTANPTISNSFQFVPTVSLYLDFTTIDYGALPNVAINKQIAGDNDLSTPIRPTVWDNGNINAQLSASATAMTLGGDVTLADPDGNSGDGTPENNYNLSKIIIAFDAYLDYKNPDGTVAQSGKINFDSVLYDDLGNTIAGVGSPKLITTTDPGTIPVLLRACHPAQFDPSVRASLAKVPGSYQGTMTLYIGAYSGHQYPLYFSNLPGVTIPNN